MEKEEARQILGQRIRSLREEQKLSVRKFALMVDLNKDYIIDIEKGRRSPSFDTILKVSSGLGVTPSELLEGIDSHKNCSAAPAHGIPKQNPSATMEGMLVRYHSTRL